MSAVQAPVWVVAGAPGAGKSTVARALAQAIQPRAALLDKDTMYSAFVTATLRAAGRPEGEREGLWYDQTIKVHEYAGMACTAREIRNCGCPVVLCAPYTSQIRDLTLWQQLTDELGGPDVHLVWVRCHPQVLHTRIIGRGSPRDSEKLARFEQFVEAVKPDVAPIVAHYAIDNSPGGPEELATPAKLAAMPTL